MGGGPSSTTQTTTANLPGWLTNISKEIVGSLKGTMFPGGQLQGYNPALSQQVAGFDPFQQQAFGMIGGLSGATGEQLGKAQQANQLLMDSSLLFASSNPYLQSNVQAMNQDIAQAYRYGTAPSEMGGAISSGAFGGSGDVLQRLQNQFGLGQNISQADVQSFMQNYQNQLGVMGQAIGQAPGIAQAQYIPAEALGAAGGQQQQQQQNVLNSITQNAWQMQNFPYQLMSQAGSILAPYLGAFSGQTTIAPNVMGK
ncbi:MAG: hypothetical protein KGJ90_01905 [Patescibacteria group bacterium]|nr:hypothetical protein [Patescibacteria group bacterium]